MTTDTAALVPPAYHLTAQVRKFVGAWVTYSSPGSGVAKRLGTLPAGAMVVGGGIFVTTAFDDSGNDYIDLGTTADDDAFATDLSAATAGFTAIDEPTNNDYTTSEIGVTATYTGQNANAAAGVAYCFIEYIEPMPNSA